jgi:putative two-component system response regulator
MAKDEINMTSTTPENKSTVLEASLPSENTSRPTILVVDDSPANLTILSDVLKDQYRVRVANSGARALAAVKIAPRPDLILLDIMMPEMDGYAVMRALRADAETADIPVIFVTAMDTDTDEEFGLLLGAVDYVTKPIRPAILMARINTHISLSHVRRMQALGPLV